MAKEQADELARAERTAATHLKLGSARWVLAGLVALYVLALFMPFAGDASGWQLLSFSGASRAAETKVAEYAFTILSCIGIAVLTTFVVITQRFHLAALAWMFTTVSFMLSILAIWLRRTSTSFDAGFHHGPGIYLAILVAGIAVFTYAPVVLRRDDRLAALAHSRADVDDRDDVALAQEKATREAAAATRQNNPLLIDDRRARAADRHKRYES